LTIPAQLGRHASLAAWKTGLSLPESNRLVVQRGLDLLLPLLPEGDPSSARSDAKP